MGKAKPVEPEPADKIIRTLGENLFIEVTEEEKKYRNKKGPDGVKQIRKEKLKCTVCGKSLADLTKKATEPYVHMVLGVLVCQDCSSFYGDGYFSVDEDGDDKYCRWCGQGGTLYLCSGCTCAFCKKCIKQNLDKQDVKDLESDDWKCFICKPKPLFECRTICWFLQEHAAKAKKEMNEENDEEETIPTRSRRDRGSRKPIKEESATPASRKRKASEAEDESETEKERGSKRCKSSDSGKESKKQTTSSNWRSRNQSMKEKEDEKESEDESLKKQTTGESRSKRSRGSKPEVESTAIKKSSRVSKRNEDSFKKKVEEITISDGEDEEKDNSIEEVPKKGASKSLRKDSSPAMAKTTKTQEEVEKKDRPKRNVSDKSVKEPTNYDSPSKRPSRSAGKNTSQSEKNKKSKKAEVVDEIEIAKRNQRSTKGNRSNKDEDEDEDIAKSDSEVHLISLDGNSESETESKRKPTKRKAFSKYSLPNKSKLHLPKNADSKLVQASGYINSALKDIKELSILISNRCEKLCTKSIESSDDVISVSNKLQQLMTGVHTNLGLIEKGLNTKISNWQEVKLEDKKIADGNVSEVKSVDNQEHTEGSSILEGEKINDEEDSSVDKNAKDTEELKISEDNVNLEMENSENPEEEMEVDDNNEEIKTDQVENEKEEKLNEKTDSELEIKNDEKEHIEEPVENISETSEKTNTEDKESDTEKNDKPVKLTEENYNNEMSLSEKVEDVKENSKEDDTEESITDNKFESVDDKFEDEETGEDTETKPENSENTTENSDESQNNKLDDLEEKNEIREKENENMVNEMVVPNCGTESLDVYNSESVDSVARQSGAIIVSKSQDNGLGDTNKSSDKEVLGSIFSEERMSDKMNEENVSPEVMDVDAGENESTTGSDKPAILEDNTNSSTPTASQSNESEELKNGTADDEKVDTEKKEDKSKEITDESTEQRSTEKKEENRIRTPSDEHKSSGSPHADPSRRLSGDRDRERERGGGGGRYSQEQRWSGDRGGSWNRDRDRYQDRGWSGRGGSWNRYEDRRPNRGGWGWNR